MTTRAQLRNSLLAAALVLAVAAVPAAPAAAQDFTRYVAIGDSLGAGFLNGGLAIHPQERSYPALIARQAGVGAGFEQPLISEPGIPPLLTIAGFSGGSPIIARRSNNPGAPLNLNLPRPYNNLSVPGFDTHDVVATVTGNALIDIVLRGQGTALQQAAFLRPTFATVWIGNNDVLGAALSGTLVDPNGNPRLTPVADFERDYRTILQTLRGVGAELAVATIPNVTALPFVTTVPRVIVDPATGQPVLINGQPVPLLGPAGPLGPGDRVLLPAAALLGQGIGIPVQLGGSGQPLPDEVVLSAGELGAIRDRTNALNDVIRRAAGDFGAALWDANVFFDRVVREGLAVGGNIVYTTDFLTGGLFSYDGVHPTPFGYAVSANQLIAAINQRFGSDVPPVDLFPFVFGPDGSAGMAIETGPLGNGTPVFGQAAVEQLFWGLRIERGNGSAPGVAPADPVRERPGKGKRPGRRGQRIRN